MDTVKRDYSFNRMGSSLHSVLSVLVPLVSFWAVLFIKIPLPIGRFFSAYSIFLFIFVLAIYFLAFCMAGRYTLWVGLGVTMLLFALTLSFKWTSGFSDNFLIGGLLPYKDAKNYYYGANLILNRMALSDAGQATERPLFPGFLSSILLLTGQNLQVSVAILVQLAGVGLYMSARQIKDSFGAVPASLLSTLLYFYIQPWLGYTMSEMLGFVLGCFAFGMLWHTAYRVRWFDLFIGLLSLMMAISARAGAFLIFPLLMFWAGWIFRGERRFSIKSAVYSAVGIFLGYTFANTLYPWLLGIRPGSAFRNLAYAVYGQVRGGIGWHSAIVELGTRDPSVVYQNAFQYFLAHPGDLVLAIAKSYRDFFLPGFESIYAFGRSEWQDWILWGVLVLLMILGLYRLVRNIRVNLAFLLLASFAGIFLSIPFLPPRDGGARFYASTIPFFFVIPAMAIVKGLDGQDESKDHSAEVSVLRYSNITMMFLTVLAPLVIFRISPYPSYDPPVCPSRQRSFVIAPKPNSYIDLVPDSVASCGLVPGICLSDFEKYNTELSTDDFYQRLIPIVQESGESVRVIPAINLLGGKFFYFLTADIELLDNSTNRIVSGCATFIPTKNQRIYRIESFAILNR